MISCNLKYLKIKYILLSTHLFGIPIHLFSQYFIKNKGQINHDIPFYVQQGEMKFYVSKNGFFINLSKEYLKTLSTENIDLQTKSTAYEIEKIHIENIHFKHLHANFKEIEYHNEINAKHHYMYGNNPDEWFENIPLYENVIVKNIYENIDLKFYYDDKNIRFDYIINPGGDVNNILIEVEGVTHNQLKVDKQNIKITLQNAIIELNDLKIYQTDAFNNKKYVNGEWKYYVENNRLYLKINCENYDESLALVVDPVIYCTYLGSNGLDVGYYVCKNTSNDIYVLGRSDNTSYPTVPGSYDVTHNGNSDIVVSRFDQNFNLIFSTYLGGSGGEVAEDMFIDPIGNIYITGGTVSTNFPLQNPIDNQYGIGGLSGSNWFWGDGFISILSPNGSNLLFSSYFGDDAADVGRSVLVENNQIYICGATMDEISTWGASGTGSSEFNILLLSINNTWNGYNFTRILNGMNGSVSDESAMAMVYNSTNNILYLTGESESSQFNILSNTYNNANTNSTEDIYVWGVDGNSGNDVFFNYLGSTQSDRSWDIMINHLNQIVVSGYGGNGISGMLNPYAGGNSDGLLLVFDLNLNYINGRYLGGSNQDQILSVKQSNINQYVVTGFTSSNDYPIAISQCYDQSQYIAGNDVNFTVITPDLTNIIYSRLIGGNQNDIGYYLQILSDGSAVITGVSYSSDFPVTANAFDNTNTVNQADIFIARFCIPDSIISAFNSTVSIESNPASLNNLCEGDSVLLFVDLQNNLSSGYTFLWNNGDTNDSIWVQINNQTQTYTVTISKDDGCEACITSTSIALPSAMQAIDITLNYSDTTHICSGNNISLNVTSNFTNATYLWNTNNTSASIVVDSTGLYTVVGSNGCSNDSAWVYVNVLQSPEIFPLQDTIWICNGQLAVLEILNSDMYPITWNDGSSGNQLIVNQGGSYYAYTSNMCGIDTVYFTVIVDTLSVSFTSSENSGYVPLFIELTNHSSENVISFQWNFGNGEFSNLENPSIEFNDTGLYQIQLIGITNQGCSDTAYQSIQVLNCNVQVYIPNTFSPNGDLINDEFIVESDCPYQGNLYIYNRWGDEIYNISGDNLIWNGKTKYDSEAVQGVYVYVIEIRNEFSSYEKYIGCIHLFK